MSGDYLWDRSGPPDPEIERLERTLAPLRYRGKLDPQRTQRPQGQVRWWAAAAATAAAIALGLFQFFPRPAFHKSAWEVVDIEGPVAVGTRTATPSTPLYTRQVLRTGRTAKVTLHSEHLGRIEVAPDSELQVLESGATHQRLGLQRGRIHALIWAPPRQFVVDTPSARAIDLGCQYTLSVDASGNGWLTVETGWVAFQFKGRESFIPAGAACVTSKQRGPGTPYFQDASELLRRSLEEFDRTGDAAAVRRVLAEARARDGLTLWHLLVRVPAPNRGDVIDRFAELVRLPPEVTREGLLANDSKMLDRCWDALGFEDTGWWRGWEREWQPQQQRASGD